MKRGHRIRYRVWINGQIIGEYVSSREAQARWQSEMKTARTGGREIVEFDPAGKVVNSFWSTRVKMPSEIDWQLVGHGEHLHAFLDTDFSRSACGIGPAKQTVRVGMGLPMPERCLNCEDCLRWTDDSGRPRPSR